MKKVIYTVALASAMALACTGCGKSNKDDNNQEVNQQIDISNISDILGNSQEDTMQDISDSDQNDDSVPVVNRDDYIQQADLIVANLEKVFEALKDGDIDTLSQFIVEDSAIMEGINSCPDKAAASEFIKIIFKDLQWKISQEDIETLVSTLAYLASQNNNSEVVVNMYIVDHISICLDDFYISTLPAGTLMPEDYTAPTEDDAKLMLNNMLDASPLICDEFVYVQEVKPDGSFKIDLDSMLYYDSLPWEELEYADAQNIYRLMIKEILDIGTDSVIDPPNAIYNNDNDNMYIVANSLINKDVANYEVLYSTYTGGTVDSNVKFDDLSEEKKQELIDLYENRVKVYVNNITRSGTNEKYGSVIYTYPYECISNLSDEYADWIKQLSVVEVEINYDNLGDAADMLKTFMYKYCRMLDYVNKN